MINPNPDCDRAPVSKPTSTPEVVEFHLPTKPYDVIDLINRIAAGQGSVGYAQSTAHADYNGHSINLSWNNYRGYYIVEHFWGERVVHARGDAAECLRVAVDEYNRQGKGAHLSVSLKVEDAHLVAGFNLIPGKQSGRPAWMDWKHDEASTAYRMERQIGLPYIKFLIDSKTEAEYKAKIDENIAQRRRSLVPVS